MAVTTAQTEEKSLNVKEVRSVNGFFKKRKCIVLFLGTASFLVINACVNKKAPIDADTRKLIDSLSTAQINVLKLQSDSLCEIAMEEQLPRLVHSLKTFRLQQIEQKLRQTLPGK